MIVAEASDHYRLITQNDHGDLAGQFAAHWGNDKFARLHPYPSMVLAAEAHDNGWWHWDVKPSVDEDGFPLAFTQTPRSIRSHFYGAGIDGVLEKDLYAGLIVSMHGVGLPQQRYGTMSTMRKRVDEYSLKFIEEREPQHKAMMARVATMEAYAGANSLEQIWFNYRMMQVFDRMSLFFCANFDIRSVPEAGAHTEGKGYYGPVINPTPIRFGLADGELRLRPLAKTRVAVDPYPFDQSPLRVGVRGRFMPRIAYKNQDAFREAYYKAPREIFEFTLTTS